jgi:circadian clock protein KaiB
VSDTPRTRGGGRPAKHRFKLYVTGQTPRSARAIATLRRLCVNALNDDCEVVVIDVLEQPHLAEEDRVMVTPTLIKELPPPARRVLGDLSDEARVLWGLQLQTNGQPRSNREGTAS